MEGKMEINVILRIINFTILFGAYVSIIVLALVSLRKRRLSHRHTAFWVLAILFFPIFGAIALWIVNPQNEAIGNGDTGKINPKSNGVMLTK
jgi:hypothetical protein